MKYIAVITTTGSADEARRIARDLVERRLAACAHVSEIESFYVWKGALENDREHRIVFKTTADQYDAVERAIKARKHRPMLMVDIAVPRDIEPEVGVLNDVYLYTVDDLKEIIDEGLRSRQQAALQAEDIIDTQTLRFMGWLRSLDAVSTIRAYRDQAEGISAAELERARRLLRSSGDPDKLKFCGAGATDLQDRQNYAVLMRVALLSSLNAADSTGSLGFRCVREVKR